jgi:ribokinase
MAPLIRVIGSLNVDIRTVIPRFPRAGETIEALSHVTSPGGKGANQAVACSRLSRRNSATSPNSNKTHSVLVQMVGAVGGRDSHFQKLLTPVLEESGLDISRVKTKDGDFTGTSIIMVVDGENSICFNPGANFSGMQPTHAIIGEALAAPIPDVIVLQGETPVETLIGIFRDITKFKSENIEKGRKGLEVGPEVVFNPAPAPPSHLPEDIYASVDHLIMNESEAEIMGPSSQTVQRVLQEAPITNSRVQMARYFHKLGVTYVVVTLGSEGAWYSAADPGKTNSSTTINGEIPADKVKKVEDTTAAGDTFVGAYVLDVARWREARYADGKSGVDLEASEKEERYRAITRAALTKASRAAARCVERQGSMDSIPWGDEVQ